MPKILLVEDDKDLASVIAEWLRAQNFEIDTTGDGIEGYEFLRQYHYDAIILDWELPGISGVELCKRYRSSRGSTPVLMLTGKNRIDDKETGFNAGADDYLTKPFNMRELGARLKALMRRPAINSDNAIRVGRLELDPIKHRLLKDGKEVHLAPRDFALLEFLMRHPDEVFSSDALIERVWSSDAEISSDAVRTSIRRLRKMIDESDDESQSFIENVRRIGYRLRIS